MCYSWTVHILVERAPLLQERDIIKHCESRVLRRARNIAQTSDAIFDRQCKYETGDTTRTRLRAKVQSSADWRINYDVDLFLEEETGKVVDYACTCAASLSNSGMCKHVTAVALTFLDAPASFSGHDSVRKAHSSSGVEKLLHVSGDAVRGYAADDAGISLIDIEPCLVTTQDAWSVRFSVVGAEGKYVIKDIPAFLMCCRRAESFSYGDRLTFVHTRSSFTPHAQKIISFIERAIDIREQIASDALNSYRANVGAARNALQLSTPEIVELLVLSCAQTLSVDDCTKFNHKATRTHIIEGNPPLRVMIEKQGSNGYALTRDVAAQLITYADTIYVWADGLFYCCDPDFAAVLPFMENVYCNTGEQAFLSSGDAVAFCKSVLPVIERAVEIDLPEELASLRPRDCEIEIYLDRDGRTCVCEAYAVYDSERVALAEAGPDARALSYGLRDDEREARARAVLGRYFPIAEGVSSSDSAHGLRVSDDSDIARILASGIAEFRELGTLFTTPAFDTFISSRHPKVTFGLSIHANLVNLTASVDDLPKKELAALIDSYHKLKRYHRLSDGSFIDLAQSNLGLADEYAAELGVQAAQLLSVPTELPLYRAFQLDGLIEDAQRDRAFCEYVTSIDEAASIQTAIPEDFIGELRPYQLEGLQWLNTVSAMGLGGILADEMGLGKTIQLIAYTLDHLEDIRAYGPLLIVCPASVVYNWVAEFERFAPTCKVGIVAGSKDERMEMLLGCASDGSRESASDVLVTSYDLLRRDIESYEQLNLFAVALDEAQYIKNHATVSARSVKSLDALHRFALTGTPIENRLSELWSIFDFLMPGLLSSYEYFRSRYEQPILDGDERAVERLQALVGHFILRRMKQDVLTDLPEKDESLVYAHLGDEQMRLYRALEQRLRESINARTRQAFSASKITVLAEITRLRELCCDPGLLYEDYDGGAAKLDTIIELVDSANDSGEKTLVFSQFVRFLDIIAARLDELHIPYYTITGSTPKRQRVELVNAFNGDETPVFLVSLKAGGTGLNLIGASVVIHADPWWNLAAENQATDRAHRIGQKKPVSVYKVIAKDTIEQRVVALQQAKSRLAEKFVRKDGTPLAALSRDELLELLQG